MNAATQNFLIIEQLNLARNSLQSGQRNAAFFYLVTAGIYLNRRTAPTMMPEAQKLAYTIQINTLNKQTGMSDTTLWGFVKTRDGMVPQQ